MIEIEIMRFIPKTKKGFSPAAPWCKIVGAILYKLRKGVQWHKLPIMAFFSEKSLIWQSVYYHCMKWYKTDPGKGYWVNFLNRHRPELDFFSIELDGAHTSAIRVGACVECQGWKNRKTTNALYLAEKTGMPLAMSEPVTGNYNDLYDIEYSLRS